MGIHVLPCEENSWWDERKDQKNKRIKCCNAPTPPRNKEHVSFFPSPSSSWGSSGRSSEEDGSSGCPESGHLHMDGLILEQALSFQWPSHVWNSTQSSLCFESLGSPAFQFNQSTERKRERETM